MCIHGLELITKWVIDRGSDHIPQPEECLGMSPASVVELRFAVAMKANCLGPVLPACEAASNLSATERRNQKQP